MSSVYREFVLSSPSVWKAVYAFIKANAQAFIDNGNPLRIIITSSEKKRNKEQNAYYFKAVIEQIADKAWLNGRQFSKEVWHEYIAGKYCPFEEFTMPDGSKKLIRKSTSDLKVSEFSTYIEQAQAYACTELGVQFDAQI